MEEKLLRLQDLLRSNGILISFSGRFSQGIIEELGDALKRHLEAEDTPKNDVFNVFSVFIEQTQNIKNYSTRKLGTHNEDKIANSGIVTIGKYEFGYFVWSGNLIENADVEKLGYQLDKICSLNKEELKKLYREQLRKESLPESMGAGVGIIDMARKASCPLRYSFNKIDDEFSFFELQVIV